MKEFCRHSYLKANYFFREHGKLFLLIGGIAALQLGLCDIAQAQTGGEIFGKAACNLLKQVLEQHFGSMITVLSGVLAIFSAVLGSFKGAWACIFVSVGCFIAEELVMILFPNLAC